MNRPMDEYSSSESKGWLVLACKSLSFTSILMKQKRRNIREREKREKKNPFRVSITP